MPAPRDEAAESVSLLQKQLILSQVQILELEDVRDELSAELTQRAKILRELQSIADRAFAEAQQSQRDEANAQQALQALRAGTQQLQLRVESLQREAGNAAQRLQEAEKTVQATKTLAAAQAARMAALDAEQRKLKASRSWRWTAPLRAVERWFQPGP